MTGRVHPEYRFKNNLARSTTVEEIATYWKYDGTECDYVESGILHPWHDSLFWSRLRYFFYWRRCVYEGVCLDTDAGYVWLHAVELLLVDDDPYENRECLLRMLEAYKGQNELVDSILTTACGYYEAVQGLDITDTEGLASSYRLIRICRILSSDGFVPLSPRDMLFMTGFKGKSMDRYAESASEIVSAALHEIGRAYSGKGILELCNRPTEIQLSLPFKNDMFDYLVAPITLSCRDVKKSEAFNDMVKSLYKTCVLRLAGKDASLTKNMSRYQSVLERCIAAWKNGTLGEIATPYRKAKYPVVVERYKPTHRNPASGHTRDGTWPSYRFAARMREYGSIVMPYSARPVPSFRPRPIYSRMSLDEYASYQSWKETVLRGGQAGENEGFMWLLVNEILHDDTMDPKSALDALRICRLHSSGHERVKIETVMADWCIFNGLDADVSELFCDSVRISALVYRSLGSDPPGPLSQGILRRLLPEDLRETDADLVNASLNALYRYHGNSLGELFNAGTSKSNVMIFENCACMPISMSMTAFSNMEDVARLLKNISTIVYPMQNGEDSPRCPTGFGAKNRDIVREAAEKAMEAKRRSRIASMSKDIKLDMDAVDSAIKDLNAVTDMMFTESSDETPAVKEETEEERPVFDDPWDDLAHRLSPELVYYIEGCIEGRRPDRKAEKTVNELAMDTVGDVVIEDGLAIEDYAEQLKTIIHNRKGHR